MSYRHLIHIVTYVYIYIYTQNVSTCMYSYTVKMCEYVHTFPSLLVRIYSDNGDRPLTNKT